MNRRLIFLAAALGTACVGTEAGAAPPRTMRTILHFSQSAWVTPAAVVLRSPQEWSLWIASMVAAERAVAAEPLPDGVDWSREALLVVAIGERNTLTTFELGPPRRSGRRLSFTGRIDISWTPSFSSPCHVVAFDRRFADSIELDPTIGVLEQPFGSGARSGASASRAGGALTSNGTAAPPGSFRAARSWGALKHLYRELGGVVR